MWPIVHSAGYTGFICAGQFSTFKKQVRICVGIFEEGCGVEDKQKFTCVLAQTTIKLLL